MDTDKRKDEQIEQDIIRAIRSRGLREQMQEWEQEAQNPSRKEKPKHRTLWRKIVYPIAAVAILAGGGGWGRPPAPMSFSHIGGRSLCGRSGTHMALLLPCGATRICSLFPQTGDLSELLGGAACAG